MPVTIQIRDRAHQNFSYLGLTDVRKFVGPDQVLSTVRAYLSNLLQAHSKL